MFLFCWVKYPVFLKGIVWSEKVPRRWLCVTQWMGIFGWIFVRYTLESKSLPFAGPRHDRSIATSLMEDCEWNFCAKGTEVHWTSLFIAFFCPLSLVLHKWALPKVTTYNFVSHGEKIIQIFICTPSNLHSVTNYLLANDSYLNSRKLSLRLSYDSLIASQLDLSGNIWHLFWIYLKNSHSSRTRCLLGREKYLRLSELPTVPYITSQGFSVLTKLGLEFCFCFCFCV